MGTQCIQRLLLGVAAVLVTMSCISPPSAQASTIEKWLVMPGPVVESHAEFEDECGACHNPATDQPQHELCVACHEDVGLDLSRYEGFHGHLLETERFECASCHAEHEGRDFKIVHLDEANFDHNQTDFELHGAHTDVACVDCHAPNERHRDAGTMCFDCHQKDDPHERRLGDACDSCHNVNNWFDTTFDHNLSAFPLTGAHKTVECNACHLSSDFTDAGTECIDCHREDDVHKGRNGTQCVDCHSTTSWSDLSFNHLAVTGFALDFGHSGLACMDCHRAKDYLDLDGSTCNSCHAADDVHEGRNGTDCASCHNVRNWRTTSFDHQTDTDFPLPAGHTDLACSSCHTSNVHDPVPRDCGGCHADDDPHEGQLGPRCEGCHVPDHWTARLWFDHDLTTFPLLGSHADVACDECHASAKFKDAQESCFDCHQDDDPHQGGLGPECGDCHNPSTWQSWVFDHNTQTSFPLTGAHEPLSCNDCHTGSTTTDNAAISDGCVSCHRRDDPHAGRFGNNCENCHTTDTFLRIEGM